MMTLLTTITMLTLLTATTGATPSTAPTQGEGAGHRPWRQRSLPNRPRRWPLWGGLASKRWVVLRAVLGRGRELHHVLRFLCFVELQRQRRDRDTASVGSMDRSGLMPKMVHGLAFRHARRTRPLCPGVTIGVQAASFYPQHSATPTKLAGTRIRVPRVHIWGWLGKRQSRSLKASSLSKFRHPERRRAVKSFFPATFAEPQPKDLATIFKMIERGGWTYIMSSHSRCLYDA